jgi:peroxiredoxin Q/BCP
VLGASYDSAADNLKFRTKFSFPFPLLCDTDHALAKAYGAYEDGKNSPNRAAVVIDGKGKIAKWWAKVDAKTFPDTVLKELPAGK